MSEKNMQFPRLLSPHEAQIYRGLLLAAQEKAQKKNDKAYLKAKNTLIEFLAERKIEPNAGNMHQIASEAGIPLGAITLSILDAVHEEVSEPFLTSRQKQNLENLKEIFERSVDVDALRIVVGHDALCLKRIGHYSLLRKDWPSPHAVIGKSINREDDTDLQNDLMKIMWITYGEFRRALKEGYVTGYPADYSFENFWSSAKEDYIRSGKPLVPSALV
jgi:hypothetical protein